MCCCDLIEWFVAPLSTRSIQWEWWVPRVQLSPSLPPAVTVSEPLLCQQARLPSSIFIRASAHQGWVEGCLLHPDPACCTHPARTSPYIPAQEPALTPKAGLFRTWERCPCCFQLVRRKYRHFSVRNTRCRNWWRTRCESASQKLVMKLRIKLSFYLFI